MEPTDSTIEILSAIRDEIKQTNQRLDQTNQRLEQNNQRLEQRLDSLYDRQTQTEVRLATEIIAVAKGVGELRDLLAEDLDLRRQVIDHDIRIMRLEQRLDPS